MPYRPNVTDKEQGDVERAADDSAIRVPWFDGKEQQQGETKSFKAYDLDQQGPNSSGATSADRQVPPTGSIVGQINDKPAQFQSDEIGRAPRDATPPSVKTFNFKVKTDNGGSGNTKFILPVPASGSYNYQVNWGDGTVDNITTNGNKTHTYPAIGTYEIRIKGRFPTMAFANGGDKAKLIEITQWGDLQWESWNQIFFGCSNLQITATDQPDLSGVTDATAAFAVCTGMTSFPKIKMDAVQNLSYTWYACTGLTSFPVIHLPAALNLTSTWQLCASLTTFPVINITNVTNLFGTWAQCANMTTFPVLNTSNVTNFDSTWGLTGIVNFPMIDTSKGTNFEECWLNCPNLETIPALDLSKGLTFEECLDGCRKLHTFGPTDMSSGINFDRAFRDTNDMTVWNAIDMSSGESFVDTWRNCEFIVTFSIRSFDSMTDGTNCFLFDTLPTTDYSEILVALNTNNPNTGVTFHGGTSKYNPTGAAARAALLARVPAWTISDGGAA